MSKIYCGTEKLPKGKKLGTMEECVKAGQIRRFGLFSVDPMLLAAKIDTGPGEKDFRNKVIGLKGKVAKFANAYKRAVDPMTKKAAAEDYRKAYEELKAAIEIYERFKKGEGPRKRELTLKPNFIKKSKKDKAKEAAEKAKAAAAKEAAKAAEKAAKVAEKAASKKKSKAASKAKPKAASKAKPKTASKAKPKPKVATKAASKKPATRKPSKKLGRTKSRINKRKNSRNANKSRRVSKIRK